MTETRKWSALAGLLVVAMFAASWFLLISPKREEAAALREQTVAKEAGNARLVEQIQMLQEQQKDLPVQEAKLATLRTQIPDNPALPALIRDLTAAGRKSGVVVDSLAPSTPVALVSAVAAPVAVATPPAGEAGATPESAAVPAPAAAAPAAEVLYQLPLTLNVSGSYFELEQFLSKLENIRRPLLVSGFSIAESTTTDSTEGDLTIALTGRVFIAQQPTTPATPVALPATTADQGSTS